MEEITGFDPKDVEENKILAAISYLGILVLIPLLVKKDSKFVMEHARQGLALFIAEIIVWLVELILGRIPGFGVVIAILANICYAVLAIVSIIALVYALMGKCWKIPVVYDFAKGLKI
ncbi:MAG: DUF4870 domain-containing protein [Caldisericaceae bacterium]|nr:DUF4870 domain-containing protein [Caldisericaceae bacterium]